MQHWLRRLRGALKMGLTWAFVWSFVGTLPRWVFGFNGDAPFPFIFGVFGMAAGTIFGALLALAEGRRRFDQMSLPRFAAWGALGGVLLATFFSTVAGFTLGESAMVIATFAAACAVSSSGSLALARRAQWRELPGGDTRPDAAELTRPAERMLRGSNDGA